MHTPVIHWTRTTNLNIVEPRFPDVSCSMCGRSFGPGNHGFSSCDEHNPPLQELLSAFRTSDIDWYDTDAREVGRFIVQHFNLTRRKS